MSTRYNTGNPIESTDVRDMSDNAKNLDLFSNSSDMAFDDRFGVERKTIHGMNSEFNSHILNMGFARIGTFASGATLTNQRQTLLWDIADGGDGQEYGWSGTFAPHGKIVPPSSSPTSTGGIAIGAWVSRFDPLAKTQIREALRRSYAEAGYNLVSGSFEAGGTLTSASDVLLHEETGMAYAGSGPFPQDVDAGTDPASGGYTSIEKLLRDDFEQYITATPAYVDAYKLPGMTDEQAIDAAMSASKHVVFGPRKYTYTKPLISIGHTLEGAVGETLSTTGTIIEFDIAVTPAIPFAYRNTINKGVVRNIRFIQKSWLCELNGCRIDRKVSMYDFDFSYFNGWSIVLESVDSEPRGCYGSLLVNPVCDYNAKDGIHYGGSANAVTVINPTCRWNGSPSYGVQPTVASIYDGINSSGIDGPFPGNGNAGEPQGNVIIGGNVSYNSRKGYNLQRWWQGSIIGGYAEVNLGGDANFVNMFGSSITNLMLQQPPTLAIPDVDPAAPSRSLLIYPNSIWINGRDFGCGQPSPVQPALWTRVAAALRYFGSNGSTWLTGTSSGGIEVSRQNTSANLKWNFGTVPTYASSMSLGDGASVPISGIPIVSRSGNTEGATLMSMVNSTHYTEFFVANSGGANAAATALRIAKNSGTSRSINAAGTVNASGADYAEYMHKDDSCGEIAKGDICGVTANGLLTDQFDRAVSFVVKSTDPAYVGGDTWGDIEEPIRHPEYEAWVTKCEAVYSGKPTLREEETEQEYATRLAEWSDLCEAVAGSEPEKRDSDEWLAWVADLKTRRQRVDRIAFCGQVPCNVVGANPGDYIVPVRNDDGSIGGIAIKDPSLEQYRRAVGAVWKVMDDGRAWIAVKVS